MYAYSRHDRPALSLHLIGHDRVSINPHRLPIIPRCILKDGELPGAKPTIVLGIGGKADQLVHVDRTSKDNVGLLRRFSGGGTVIVDQDSLFATFIMNTVRACVKGSPGRTVEMGRRAGRVKGVPKPGPNIPVNALFVSPFTGGDDPRQAVPAAHHALDGRGVRPRLPTRRGAGDGGTCVCLYICLLAPLGVAIGFGSWFFGGWRGTGHTLRSLLCSLYDTRTRTRPMRSRSSCGRTTTSLGSSSSGATPRVRGFIG